MQEPKWPVILLACGPGEVIVIVWDRFCISVELLVRRRLCSIFESDVGLPNIHEYSAG